MRFAARKLELPVCVEVLHAQSVKSWFDQSKWVASSARQAIPLALETCVELERALSTCDADDRYLLLCFFLMRSAAG